MKEREKRNPSELRRRAEATARKRGKGELNLSELSKKEFRSLVHELDVHRIELEMQNEELDRVLHELEKTRDRYSNLYDFSPVGYFTLTKGKILEANLTGARLLGVARQKLLKRPLTDFILAEDQDIFYRLKRQILKKPVQQHAEIRMLKEGGSPFYVQMEGLVIRDERGDMTEQRIAIADISERKRMEEEKKMFFSIAGHELRTPVTNLGLSLDLLLDGVAGELPPPVRHMADIARSSIGRLKRLVDDILDLQKTEAGAIAFHVQPLALMPLLQEAVESLRAYAGSFDVDLALEPCPPEVKVAVDGDRLIQVIINLLSNAARFAPAGDTVRVAAAASGSSVRVLVTDHGPGIPESFQARIFEPFTQAVPSLENPRHRKSAGLGLSIARAILERMDGRIGFETEPEVATTFYFDLPEWKDKNLSRDR